MILLLAALLTLVAFAVLVRLLWLKARPGRYATLITVAAAVLVLGLALLAASGRLHWLAAVAAAVFPFLRRAAGLVRFLPVLGPLLKRLRAGRGSADAGSRGAGAAAGMGAMSRQEALEILGLTGNPPRDEIIAAHRRLIQKLHPDRGGSTYLARQLNEAKRRLLEEA